MIQQREGITKHFAWGSTTASAEGSVTKAGTWQGREKTTDCSGEHGVMIAEECLSRCDLEYIHTGREKARYEDEMMEVSWN